jgi:hypothetical protein
MADLQSTGSSIQLQAIFVNTLAVRDIPDFHNTWCLWWFRSSMLIKLGSPHRSFVQFAAGTPCGILDFTFLSQSKGGDAWLSSRLLHCVFG